MSMDNSLKVAFPGVRTWSQLAKLDMSPDERVRYEQAYSLRSSGYSVEELQHIFNLDVTLDELSAKDRLEWSIGQNSELVNSLRSAGLRPVICLSPRGRFHLSGISDEYYFVLLAPGYYRNLAGQVVNRFGLPLTASEAKFYRDNYGDYEAPESSVYTDNILVIPD